MNGVLFIKAVLEAWVRSRCAEVEKVGGEDVLRIQNFTLSTLISCFPFAVQVEITGRLLAAGPCLRTAVVKSTGSGAGTSGVESQIHFPREPHCLGLPVWKTG